MTKFEPGKVYVVEFWATWCGGCIRSMPHLGRVEKSIQGTWRDDHRLHVRVTFAKSSPTLRKKWRRSSRSGGRCLGTRSRTLMTTPTFDAWVTASARHFPCIFVVDRAGRIAYIGGPLFLELAIRQASGGDVRAKVIGDEMAKVEADYKSLCAICCDHDRGGTSSRVNLGSFFPSNQCEFEAKYPTLTDCLPVAGIKLMLLLKHGTNHGESGYLLYAENRVLAKSIWQRERFSAGSLRECVTGKRKEGECRTRGSAYVHGREALVRTDGRAKNVYSLLRVCRRLSRQRRQCQSKGMRLTKPSLPPPESHPLTSRRSKKKPGGWGQRNEASLLRRTREVNFAGRKNFQKPAWFDQRPEPDRSRFVGHNLPAPTHENLSFTPAGTPRRSPESLCCMNCY